MSKALTKVIAVASGGLGARILLQTLSLIIVARALSSAEYGLISAMVAMTSILLPFSSLGFDALLVRSVSKDRDLFPSAWGKALATTIASGTAMTLLIMVLANVILPSTTSKLLIALVGISDLVFLKSIECCSKTFQAFEKPAISAWLTSFPAALRSLGFGSVYLISGELSLSVWAWIYCLSAALPGVVYIFVVSLRYGLPRFDFRGWKREARSGFFFAINASADKTNGDADKLLLARLSTLEITGHYALAYRCLTIACIPIHALLLTTYARFFQFGKDGVEACWIYARSLTRYAAIMAGLLSLACFLLSPLLQTIFGPKYSTSIDILRYLSPVPLIITLRYLLSHVLGACGFERSRSLMTILAAGINILLNLLFIPRHGWHAAASITLITEVLLCIGFFLLIRHARRSAHHEFAG